MPHALEVRFWLVAGIVGSVVFWLVQILAGSGTITEFIGEQIAAAGAYNVRIVLDGSYLAEVVDEPAAEDLELYAKVVSVHPGHPSPGGIATSLVFTSLSPSARRALDQARDFAGHPA
jgi:hypothetical protein